MCSIADAPWVREAERTGYSRYGYFNAPQDATDATSCDRCGELIYLGAEFFDVDGEHLCGECMDALLHRMRRRWGE